MVVTMTAAEAEGAQRLHAQLTRTATGQRWERIFRIHLGEVDGLMSIHADLREAVASALVAIAKVCPVAEDASLDESAFAAAGEALESARQVLEGLARLGSFELSRDARTLREELDDARARALLGRALA